MFHFKTTQKYKFSVTNDKPATSIDQLETEILKIIPYLLLRFIPISIQHTFTQQSITHLPFIKIFCHRPEGNTPTKTRSDNLLHEDDTSLKRYKNSNKKNFIQRSSRQIDLVRVLRKWVPLWYCIEAHATPVLRLNIIINIIIIRSLFIVYFVSSFLSVFLSSG